MTSHRDVTAVMSNLGESRPKFAAIGLLVSEFF